MDLTTRLLTMGASGSGSAPTYVEDVFSTWLYTGNGSTQTITNGIDLSGKGGLVWIKARSAPENNVLFDTARGNTKRLISNLTNAESTISDEITAFNSTGFTLGAGSTGFTNNSGGTFASWTFRKAAKFFDVVTYTGTGSARTIAHNLDSVPGCIIVKRTDIAADWQVYHRSLANTEYLVLNNTTAKAAADRWNSTTPTSTVFSLGTAGATNASGGTYVAYLFAHDAGGFGDSGNDSVVKCGSWTVTGSSQDIDLGWEPQWLLVKRTDSVGAWYVVDNMRGFSNGQTAILYPHLSNAEYTDGTAYLIPTATGFKHSGLYSTSSTVAYIAIRRGPMKTPTDATKVFSAITATASTGTSRTIGFPSDLIWARRRNAVNGPQAVDRLRGLATSSSSTTQPTFDMAVNTNAESTGASPTVYDVWNDTAKDGSYYNGVSTIWHHFRRAPGFFDVVAYTGTGVARTVSHNLNVAPELMIVKRRDTTGLWAVYSSALGATDYLLLHTTAAKDTASVVWNNVSPTSSAFTVGTSSSTNASAGTYVAYLFASCPGVSKVGSYTGTGTTLSVDCGFTNGCRFVLIKRTDSTGDWYVWDTARGIIAANDPYLLINSTAAEVTNTDYIDPLNSGFQISSTAPAAINANGGSFIFLAIA